MRCSIPLCRWPEPQWTDYRRGRDPADSAPRPGWSEQLPDGQPPARAGRLVENYPGSTAACTLGCEVVTLVLRAGPTVRHPATLTLALGTRARTCDPAINISAPTVEPKGYGASILSDDPQKSLVACPSSERARSSLCSSYRCRALGLQAQMPRRSPYSRPPLLVRARR